MISIESLQEYLLNDNKNNDLLNNNNGNDNNIENHDNNLVFKLPSKIQNENTHIYDKYILENKFSFLNKNLKKLPNNLSELLNVKDDFFILKDNNKYNTFIYSILYIIFPEFKYFDFNSKKKFINDLMNQMAYDLQEQNFYSYFNYNKNHKFSRTELSKKLNLHENIDSYEFEYIKKYVVDYFSLSVYIVSEINNKIKINKIFYDNFHDKSVYNNLEKYNSKIILYKENNIFYPILKEDANGLFLYSFDSNIIDSLENNFSNFNTQSNLKNLGTKKLKELQDICLDLDLDIYKTNNKGNNVKKTIKELISMIKENQ